MAPDRITGLCKNSEQHLQRMLQAMQGFTKVIILDGHTSDGTLAIAADSAQEEGMRECRISGPIRHYAYSSLSDFLRKMAYYSTLFAQQNRGKRSATLFSAIAHGGFLDGVEGYTISVYQAHTACHKYMQLREANRQTPCC